MNFTHSLTTIVTWNEEEGCWIASVGQYSDLQGEGDTKFEALEDLEQKILKAEESRLVPVQGLVQDNPNAGAHHNEADEQATEAEHD